MQVPLKLTFRNVQTTEDVVALIQKQVDKLGPRLPESPWDLPAPPRGWEAAGRRRAVVRKRAGKAR